MSETTAGNEEQKGGTFFDGFSSLCSLLAIWLFVVTFLFQNFAIPSSSMASTLLVGDHVVVDRLNPMPPEPWARFVRHNDVHRGEIIVFYKPPAEANGGHLFLVKRVIGVPGDRIHLRRGIVYLKGVAQDEPKAAKPSNANYNAYRDDFPSVSPPQDAGLTSEWWVDLPNHIDGEDLVVPPESYFVMGDNRTNSADGRYWGFVPRANIVGRPLFVYWSFPTPENEVDKTRFSEKAASTMHKIVHFFDQTRWRRTLQLVE